MKEIQNYETALKDKDKTIEKLKGISEINCQLIHEVTNSPINQDKSRHDFEKVREINQMVNKALCDEVGNNEKEELNVDHDVRKNSIEISNLCVSYEPETMAEFDQVKFHCFNRE